MSSSQNIPAHPILGQPKNVYRRVQSRGSIIIVILFLLLSLAGMGSKVWSILNYGRFHTYGPFLGDYLAWGLFLAIQFTIFAGSAYALYRYHQYRHLRITVYDGGLTWTVKDVETVIRWNEMSALRHNESNTSFRGMRIIVKNYQLELADGRSFFFGRLLENVESLGLHIKNQLSRQLKPTLQTQLHQGQTISFGKLRLSRDGLHHRSRVIPWSSIETMTTANSTSGIVLNDRWLSSKSGRG